MRIHSLMPTPCYVLDAVRVVCWLPLYHWTCHHGRSETLFATYQHLVCVLGPVISMNLWRVTDAVVHCVASCPFEDDPRTRRGFISGRNIGRPKHSVVLVYAAGQTLDGGGGEWREARIIERVDLIAPYIMMRRFCGMAGLEGTGLKEATRESGEAIRDVKCQSRVLLLRKSEQDIDRSFPSKQLPSCPGLPCLELR
jgi:hypothetical protein